MSVQKKLINNIFATVFLCSVLLLTELERYDNTTFVRSEGIMRIIAFHCDEAEYKPISPTEAYFVSKMIAHQLHIVNELSCKAPGKENATSLFLKSCFIWPRFIRPNKARFQK